MFNVPPKERNRGFQMAIIGLLTLSAIGFLGSVWVMYDFLKEQAIVEQMKEQLPPEAKESATALAGELQWQFRLSLLVLTNLIATVIAVLLLSRAYRSSQESLRDVKVLAADILGSMQQGVVTTDLQGNVTSINRRGRELLETDLEIIGKPLKDLNQKLPLAEFRQQWQMSMDKTETRDFPIIHQGTPRILRASCQMLGDYTGAENGQVLQLRDVTERVLIEERMRRMERYMALGSLAAGLHHEIKNPLAAVSLHIQLIEEQYPDGDTHEVAEMLRIVRAEISRIGAVLEGFRDFAAVGRLNLSQVDPAALVLSQINLIQPRAHHRNVKIQFQPPDDLPLIEADRVRLEQVLHNLLVNALEAMPAGGDLKLSIDYDPSVVRIHVTDAGPGIPEDLHQRIFDPYFTTKGEGTGLGLALCDKIVRQHQGGLDFQSRPGQTTFTMTLPIQQTTVE